MNKKKRETQNGKTKNQKKNIYIYLYLHNFNPKNDLKMRQNKKIYLLKNHLYYY